MFKLILEAMRQFRLNYQMQATGLMILGYAVMRLEDADLLNPMTDVTTKEMVYTMLQVLENHEDLKMTSFWTIDDVAFNSPLAKELFGESTESPFLKSRDTTWITNGQTDELCSGDRTTGLLIRWYLTLPLDQTVIGSNGFDPRCKIHHRLGL